MVSINTFSVKLDLSFETSSNFEIGMIPTFREKTFHVHVLILSTVLVHGLENSLN